MSQLQDYLKAKRIKELGYPKVYFIHSTKKGVDKPIGLQVVDITDYTESNLYHFDVYPYEVYFSINETSHKFEGYATGFGDLWGYTNFFCFSLDEAEKYYQEELSRVNSKYHKCDFNFEKGDVVNFCDEEYHLNENNGSTGVVKSIGDNVYLRNFYWKYQDDITTFVRKSTIKELAELELKD